MPLSVSSRQRAARAALACRLPTASRPPPGLPRSQSLTGRLGEGLLRGDDDRVDAHRAAERSCRLARRIARLEARHADAVAAADRFHLGAVPALGDILAQLIGARLAAERSDMQRV